MRRASLARVSLAALALALAGACARQPPSVSVRVGQVPLTLVVPRGWDHVDNGARHEFRSGELRIVLVDAGVAEPESLASEVRAARVIERTGRTREAIARLGERSDPVLELLTLDQRRAFWRYFDDVSYDPTRSETPELDDAFDTLEARALALPRPTLGGLAGWVYASRLDTLRHEIESAELGRDGWWQVRAWSRMAHTDRKRFACRVACGRLLVLETATPEAPGVESAFDVLMRSIEIPERAAR
ncbi:MAG TPA: hypothetical protein VI504_12610 [Candidatus Eisenbacteria bacterium]